MTTNRITARKYGGDDSGSWAVFVDGRPAYTGLTRSEVDYYKRLVAEKYGLQEELEREKKRREAARERHWRRTGVSEETIAWMKRTGSL